MKRSEMTERALSPSIKSCTCTNQNIRLHPQAGLAVFLRFHEEKPGCAVGLVLHKGQTLGLQPVGPQHGQHLGQPLRPVAQRKAPAVLQKPERAGAHILQRAGVLVPGKGVGGVRTLGPVRKVRRIARAQVETALAFPPAAQVGAHRCDVVKALLGYSFGQQCAALGLQLQRGAGPAVAPVVPFQRHDAAAGSQVRRLLGAFRCTETGQQQCIRAKTVGRGTIYHGPIIQNFRRMFHRVCTESSQKNQGNYSRNLCKNKKQQTRFGQVCCF